MKVRLVVDLVNEGKIDMIQPIKAKLARSKLDLIDEGKIVSDYPSKARSLRIQILKILHEMFELRIIRFDNVQDVCKN